MLISPKGSQECEKIFQKKYLYFSIDPYALVLFSYFYRHYAHCADRHGKASRFKSSDINKMLLRISDGLGSSPYEIGCKTWTNFSSFLCQFFSMFLRILQSVSYFQKFPSDILHLFWICKAAELRWAKSSQVKSSRCWVPDPSL